MNHSKQYYRDFNKNHTYDVQFIVENMTKDDDKVVMSFDDIDNALSYMNKKIETDSYFKGWKIYEVYGARAK